ncbi:MAG: AlpA family phage regulatory protein [Planctomycetota bacterium]|nr:AlpA family phage regulatory protein [Planctomycetota bacterium]
MPDTAQALAILASPAPAPAPVAPAVAPLPLLIDAAEACRLLGIGRSLFFALKSAGRLPDPVHLGRSVRWGRAELTAWVAAGCPPRETWESRYRKALPCLE